MFRMRMQSGIVIETDTFAEFKEVVAISKERLLPSPEPALVERDGDPALMRFGSTNAVAEAKEPKMEDLVLAVMTPGKNMTQGEIEDAIKADHPDAKSATIKCNVSNLYLKGTLQRVDRGIYRRKQEDAA